MVDVVRKVGGRLTQPVNSLLQKRLYPGPLESLRRSYEAFHSFDKAHTVALAEEGIIPLKSAKAILNGLREMEREGIEKVRDAMGGGRHSGEAFLSSRINPDDAGWINLGRSSGDLDAVAWRFVSRARIVEVLRELLLIRKTFVTLAEKHFDTVMPSYTCLQHAQTTTFAHMLLSWEAPFCRDTKRLFSVYEAAGGSPAGSGILTGSNFPIPRHRTADLLGFERVQMNTRDAVLNLDVALETHSVVAICIENLIRISCDLHLWTTREFAMVELADEYCSTSSIMPQKKNPWSLACIKGQGSLALGRLTGVFTMLRAESDQLESTLLLPWELWKAFDDVTDMLSLLNGIIATLKVNTTQMFKMVNENWCQATDLAAIMVKAKSLPWRKAHQLTAAIVREAIEKKITPSSLTPAFIDQVAIASGLKPLGLEEAEVSSALDPFNAVQTRGCVEGSPAPSCVKKQVETVKYQLVEDEEKLNHLCEHNARAKENLEKAVDAIIQEENA